MRKKKQAWAWFSMESASDMVEGSKGGNVAFLPQKGAGLCINPSPFNEIF